MCRTGSTELVYRYLVLAGAGREAVVAAAAAAVAQQGREAGRQRPGVAAVWAGTRAVPPPSNFAVPVKKDPCSVVHPDPPH
jgi:hypothetical protein